MDNDSPGRRHSSRWRAAQININTTDKDVFPDLEEEDSPADGGGDDGPADDEEVARVVANHVVHGQTEASERGLETGKEASEKGLETGKGVLEKGAETGQEVL